MNRQTSTKPSSCVESIRELGTTLRSLKHAWCRASRFVPDTLASAIDLVLSVAHVLTSRGCCLARSVAFSHSPISIYQNKGGNALWDFFLFRGVVLLVPVLRWLILGLLMMLPLPMLLMLLLPLLLRCRSFPLLADATPVSADGGVVVMDDDANDAAANDAAPPCRFAAVRIVHE